MKKNWRKYAKYLLTAVLAVSLTMILIQHFSDERADDSYEQAQELALASPRETEAETQPTEETVPPTQPPELIWIPEPLEEEDPHIQELEAMDLDALREVNEEVVGWIRIPDTKIDYPIVQGEDNQFYLKNSWNLVRTGSGAIFLECRNNPDFTDFNTIVYGHNMRSGSMFASLRQYSNQKHYDAHPYVYVRTDSGTYRYPIFSAYRAPVDSGTYGLSFNQKKTRETFLETAIESSAIETGITPAITDRILTLSTCSGAGHTNRWVVHASLKMIQVEAE